MLKRYIFFPAIWTTILVLWALPALAEMTVDTAWVRRYDGPGNQRDKASAIAVDSSGNVYVTGGSDGIGTGDVEDYATIKYYPNGDTAWVRRYNGPANKVDEAYAIAVDDSGNVYVTGESIEGSHSDYATIKYYPNGDTAWVRRYNGSQNDDDVARSIAVDGSGNVYVTGAVFNNIATTEVDYGTIKYYANGDTAWVRIYDGPPSGSDAAYAIAVDDSGNVYVTGVSTGRVDKGGYDYATIKYYPNGDTAWVRRYNGPANGWDRAWAIAVDCSHNVYVTGDSWGSGTNYDYATIKYYPNGDTAWVRTYNGSQNGEDIAHRIVVDSSGNVYVTGWSVGSGTNYDYATIKYYPNGDSAWVRRYNGPGNWYDRACAIAVDDSDNVYVTGASTEGSHNDYATIKYYPNGDTAWVRRYNEPENHNDAPYGIAVDGSGNVYVTGNSYVDSTNYDYATIKYCQTIRGDANQDGVIDVGDVVYFINYLFENGPCVCPLEAGNVNCDGVVDVVDVVYLINYLFIGGPPPCEP